MTPAILANLVTKYFQLHDSEGKPRKSMADEGQKLWNGLKNNASELEKFMSQNPVQRITGIKAWVKVNPRKDESPNVIKARALHNFWW